MLIVKNERFDFVPPLRFSKNFTDLGEDDSQFEMPFVSSKRPEEIKKTMKQRVKIPKIHLWSNDYRDIIEGEVPLV